MDIITLAAAKKYTDNTVIGGGAIKGKNCTIDSITAITGGHRITFKWTLDDGTEQTSTLDVMDGEKGDKGDKGSKGDTGATGANGADGEDGVSITEAEIDEYGHLILTFSDGDVEDVGQVSGGTSVEANVEEVATEDLHNIKIGNTVYAIPTNVEVDIVPRLTANDSAPLIGIASDSNPVSASFQPWHAFATEEEFNASTNGDYWATQSSNGYLQFAFENFVTITKVKYAVYDTCTFQIQYSEDGTNWTDGDSITRSRKAGSSQYICVAEETQLSAPIYCKYFRFKGTANADQNIGAVHLMGFEGSGSEGTTVIANPSEEATDDLTKIQIGSTVYDISSGGGSDYIDVVGTLTAGSTSITLSSPKIKTSSCVFPWTSVFGLTPTNMVVQNGSVTLTFPAQQSDVDVMVRVTKVNTGHVYDIDLSTLQANKSWFYYDNVLSSVNDTGDGLQLLGNDTRGDWTTSATIGINIANMIGIIPVGLTALKLHFKTFEMEGYTGVRFINSNTLFSGQAGGADTMLRTNGFYQFENNDSSIVEEDYELTVPCTASNLADTYLYIMFFDGMVAGDTSGYNNGLNGAYNIIIDGIDFVTGGN